MGCKNGPRPSSEDQQQETAAGHHKVGGEHGQGLYCPDSISTRSPWWTMSLHQKPQLLRRQPFLTVDSRSVTLLTPQYCFVPLLPQHSPQVSCLDTSSASCHNSDCIRVNLRKATAHFSALPWLSTPSLPLLVTVQIQSTEPPSSLPFSSPSQASHWLFLFPGQSYCLQYREWTSPLNM